MSDNGAGDRPRLSNNEELRDVDKRRKDSGLEHH